MFAVCLPACLVAIHWRRVFVTHPPCPFFGRHAHLTDCCHWCAFALHMQIIQKWCNLANHPLHFAAVVIIPTVNQLIAGCVQPRMLKFVANRNGQSDKCCALHTIISCMQCTSKTTKHKTRSNRPMNGTHVESNSKQGHMCGCTTLVRLTIPICHKF